MFSNKNIGDYRIFQQETNEYSRYLLIPSDKIEDYLYLEYYIGIKKGDLLSPNKWLLFGTNAPKVVKKDLFDIKEYELLFYSDDTHLVRDIEKVLDGHIEVTLEKELKPLLAVTQLPSEVEAPIKDVLMAEGIKEEDIQTVEVYACERNHEVYYLNLDHETNDDEITYEYTQDFQKLYLVAEYQRANQGQSESLFKTVPLPHKENGILHHSSEEKWYHLYQGDVDYPVWMLKQIYDMEEMLAFTSFTLAYSPFIALPK
jgi:hypothetical protein